MLKKLRPRKVRRKINNSIDSIAAIATPPGRGGVGIVRISGPQAYSVAQKLTGIDPKLRVAHHVSFKDASGDPIDDGLVIYFKAPNSFTGEDVIELQGHGGPVVMDMLLQEVLNNGVRMARAGEFSERAFLNDKIDLTQAEAIADLIDAGSATAARKALRSLQGAFSIEIQELLTSLIELRIFVEAAIDFPEEEIDFLDDQRIKDQLEQVTNNVLRVQKCAEQGAILREGMQVVIVGKPNAGKSSLLNALANKESAIVTDIPGTTRDLLKEEILIDGIPVHVTDTAGLRESDDPVEKIGIERAYQAITNADVILLVYDGTEVKPELESLWPESFELPKIPMIYIKNKIDLLDESAMKANSAENTEINLSAKTQKGINQLRTVLKQIIGFDESVESQFMARRRHLDALRKVMIHLTEANNQLKNKSGELLAEELRIAQQHLSEITGEFTSDDLLGHIFSSFCIGK